MSALINLLEWLISHSGVSEREAGDALALLPHIEAGTTPGGEAPDGEHAGQGSFTPLDRDAEIEALTARLAQLHAQAGPESAGEA